ncbi:hypothetical protein EPUS_01931 [Endocarpon pusillum Z07020]|uniref:Uncharacterized protein n=1 Tax=Endocarpon pusillum (strain Z07020 / HMAS-L-300199) TaxID=1263415 RepID=U1GD26_ENDPU|nr:uncharacterized protein EPUS_01931 [Endocarpon pusillum Z07020]ERF69601.1 hypothetical protein EPUS_01931 [Endocarpon pusillum Z07020]
MCQLLITHFNGCPHIDHIPGEQHEIPIYCPNIVFVEGGISTKHEACWVCRYTAARGEQVQEEGGREGAVNSTREEEGEQKGEGEQKEEEQGNRRGEEQEKTT